MLVYGDHEEIADPREQLQRVAATVDEVRRLPEGLDRHSALVDALIEAGRLLQGIADAGSPPDELNQFVHALAGCAIRSFDSGYAEVGELPQMPTCPLPRSVELRLPEGFAFYAVYPEAYALAARKLRLGAPPLVIGIRSIGTTLGAVVAAALDTSPAITVRPFGDPFARKVELPPEIVEDQVHYVIVDEGPGLSGSSFGAVADWLERRGVPLERIAFVPSHSDDPGPHASDAHRERWARAQRVPAEFDRAFLEEKFGAVHEFNGGGAWRRRKYLAERNGSTVLLKFAGLGSIGECKLDMARTLHAAGLAPEPLGLLHGFLAERWVEGRPLDHDERPVEEIGRYIGARARLFPAAGASGASIGQLAEMAQRNIALAVDDRTAPSAAEVDSERLQQRVRRISTDNKLDREEWLRTPDGRLLKTDALDHHQDHDLVGCQGVEWDLAGAGIEFELDESETDALIDAAAVPVDRELLEFCQIAYAAFRTGQARLAGEREAKERYSDALVHLLHQNSRACKSAGILA